MQIDFISNKMETHQECVRNAFDEKFLYRWIGRGGPVAWPPRSLDLTPYCDFFCRDTYKIPFFKNI